MAKRRTLLARFAAMGIAIPSMGAAAPRPNATVVVPVATLLQIAELLERSIAGHAKAARQIDVVMLLLQRRIAPQEVEALLT